MNQEEDLKYEWWFAGIRHLPDRKKKIFREMYGNGKEIYKALYNIEEKHFNRLYGVWDPDIQLVRKSAREQDVDRLYGEAVEKGIRLVIYDMEEYPGRLKAIEGMPYALYIKGRLPDEDSPAAAIVGARRCTPYGEKMAVEFAESLALSGIQIISGMASGIDGAAQRAAIDVGGSSFGVLGCGIDICYPRENRGLYSDLQTAGGILSEQPAGAPPLREYFPARNRMISGLSDVVLVIEARERSGSLITADFALEQGKDVYALPGPVTSGLSRGCHELIRQGAGILITPEKLMEDMGMGTASSAWKEGRKKGKNKKMLESNENLVYASIGLFPRSLNDLMLETGLKAEELIRILGLLEIKGYIRELSKNYFVKI